MRQEAVDDTRNLGFVRNVTAGRSETGDVGPGWNNNRTLGVIIRVQAVLLGAFLRSAGYYQACVLQHRFFGGDSPAKIELTFQRLWFTALRQQPLMFASSKRMAGMNLRDAQKLGKLHPDISRIGIMAMNDIGQPLLLAQKKQCAVHQLIKIGPQALLTQVAARTAWKTNDARMLTQ